MNKESPVRPGDDVFVVDKIDNRYQLCSGTVLCIDSHVGHYALVDWKNPKRDPAYRNMSALSKTGIIAILQRYDLDNDTMQEVTEDAKNRGLIAVG